MKKPNLQESSYKYKFSIIMAVYNVELFLAEAIESVVKQDIGFEKNVQLILVNDGSKDGSGKICDEYHEKYPDNIVVIHKENSGVSSTRNEGLKHIEGEYVNCLDSDDLLSVNTLSCVYRKFKEWENEVDLVAIPLKFFDGKTGDHILNYKFDMGTRMIDLQEEYDKPLLSMSSSFIKNSVVSQYEFDERLAYAEDAKIVVQVLQQRMKYGVVAEACYWYRKRVTGTLSAIQSSINNKKWYLDYLRYFSLWTVENSKAKNGGKVPLFVQYTLMYDLQWRINSMQSPALVIGEEAGKEYEELLKKALSSIEDNIIMLQRQMDTEHKFYALLLKYGSDLQRRIVKDDIEYDYHDSPVFSESCFTAKVEFIEITGKTVRLEGAMIFPSCNLEDRIEIWLSVNGKEYVCENVDRDSVSISMGEMIAYSKGFQCQFEADPEIVTEVRLCCKINGHPIEKKNICFGKFSPIQNRMWNSYFVSKPFLLTHSENAIFLKPYTLLRHIYREASFLKALLKLKSKPAYKAILMRTLCHLYRLFPHKEVWVLSDRIDKADDNGEALFEYINQCKPQGIRCYFAVSKESPDYERLKKDGKVIDFLGWKYKWVCLCGAKVISSQAEEYIYRPFAEYSYCYADLMHKNKFIFLQHGVTKDDLSGWLKRFHKNIHMFVTTTVPEYQSIIGGKYGYNSDVVQLTGFPRYDRLYHDEKKYITIIPSWRAYLVGDIDVHTGKRKVLDSFLTSRYCKMYSELLTDKELLLYAKKHGYTIRFMSHPNMRACTELMSFDSHVEILPDKNMPYREIFAESNLIITDYSSIAFDFAYLRKPVIYFQADKDEFFSGSHTYDKGYFDYERDGFGEVVYDTATLIELIKQYVAADCELKEQYRKRIDETFPYADRDNSKRVYEAICNLKQS